MTPERQKELRELGQKYGHPASSLIDQAANYIENLEQRVSRTNLLAAKLRNELDEIKDNSV